MNSAEQPLLLPTSNLAYETEEDGEASSSLSPSPRFRHRLSIDDVLSNWAGEFGLAQFVHFSLASLAWTLEALQTMLMIFADKTPSWACSPSSSLAGTCSTASSSLCSLDPSLWDWVGSHHQSTVSEWGLICGQDYKIGMVQSAFFIGALLGAGLFGCLSDSQLGRKGTLALVCILNALTGILTAFSPNYWTYFALRTATGVSAGGLGLSSFVLATEPVGPSKRGAVGMSTFYFFSAGIMALSGLALFSSSWRHLCIIASIPSLIYCILILPFLKESPRWYLVQGRADDAMKVLASIAKWNGKFLPHDVTITIEQENEDIESGTQCACIQKLGSQDDDFLILECSRTSSQRAYGTILDVLKAPLTRTRMLIMIFVWLSVALVYYGISLNVSNLGTNLYLSVLLNAAAEMPAFALTAVSIEKFGRRYVLMVTFLLGAVCCMFGAIVPGQQDDSLLNYSLSGQDLAGSGSVMRLACGVVTIFGMAGAYNLLYIYTAELFPTVVRNAALGIASQAAQIGAIVAPMVVVLGKLHPAIPFGIFAIASVVGGLLACKLPETLHSPMYETLEGMERSQRLEG